MNDYTKRHAPSALLEPGVRILLAGQEVGQNDEGALVNRYLRRMQRFGKSFSARRSQSEMTNTSDELVGTDRQPDQLSVRAKNSRKGGVTADKWNQ